MAKPRPDPLSRDPPASRKRACAWPGCAGEGAYRAPVSKTRLREYQHFCLEHIREFNGTWNYFDGWDRQGIEAFQHADLTWHRRTWSGRDRGSPSGAWSEAALRDVFARGFAWTDAAAPNGSARPRSRTNGAGAAEQRRALATLGLDERATADDVKRRFKQQVKLCHPDVNGGDRGAEARLRDVIWAYRHLSGRQAG